MEHVTHVGSEEIHKGFWWEEVKDRDHLEDQGVNERIMLRFILKFHDGMLIGGSEQGEEATCCASSNEYLVT
jgi:hypothetical protein